MFRYQREIAAVLLAPLAMLSLSGCGTTQNAQVMAVEETVTEEVQEDGLPVREKEGERLPEIQESSVLLIGISPDYAPFAFLEEDEDGERVCAGSDVSLGDYIAQELGVEARYVEMEFEECLEAVQDGEVDLVLLGMLVKEERTQYLDFTDAYYTPGQQVLVVREEEAENYPTLEELAEKTVAAQYGTLQAQLVTEQLPESYMELIDSVTESLAMLRAGTVDAVALDEAVAEDVLEEYADFTLAEASLEYEGQPVAGGVVKGETELLDAVNEILEDVADQKLYYDWLAAAFSLAASVQTPVEELAQ